MVVRKQWVQALFLLFIMMCFSGVALAEGEGVPVQPIGDIQDPLQSIGEFFGWVTLGVAVIGAGSLFIFRTCLKRFKNAVPEMKDMLASGAKTMRKWHVPTGLIAFVIALIHGGVMYLHEGHIEMNEWLGIAAAGLMAVGVILGIVLALQKNISSLLRLVHSFIFMFAGIAVIIHLIV
jgi:hypothetical protein